MLALKHKDEEVRALEVAGYAPVVDETALHRGKLVISAKVPVFGEVRELTICYPDLFPYFRPEFFCPGLTAAQRHYDLKTSIMCLIERGTHNWQPSWTAAKILKERIRDWERHATCSAASTKPNSERIPSLQEIIEDDDQAEPSSNYCSTVQGGAVFVDSSWVIPPDYVKGRFRISLPPRTRTGIPFNHLATSLVVSVLDSVGRPIAKAVQEWEKWLARVGAEEREYQWIRVPGPLPFRTASEAMDYIKEQDAKTYKLIVKEVEHGRSGFFGFLFNEEIKKGVVGENWIFLIYDSSTLKKSSAKGSGLSTENYHLLKAEPVGVRDMFERISELQPLRQKTVAIVGLGCVGAPSALSFARSGVGKLRLLDCDGISPGTICRWPLGISHAPSSKILSLTRFIETNYPFTQVLNDFHPGVPDGQPFFGVRLGDVAASYDQEVLINRFLNGVDLIYDASSEDGITHLLSDKAKELSIPLVVASSSIGGCGGQVFRILPNRTGCFVCYYHWKADGDIPSPAENIVAKLQPVGCGDVTFQASDFDVSEVASAGVRMASSILCEGAERKYPWIDNDVGVLSLRSNDLTTFPTWTSCKLPVHPKCNCCNT